MGSLGLTEIALIAILILVKIGFFGAIVYGAVYLYHRLNKVKK